MSRLPATLAYKLIRRGCSPANLDSARHAMAARRAWPAADGGGLAQQTKASGPGDQARPRGLKPRGAAAAAARCVPSRRQRSSHAAGDRLLSGAGDQAGGCSGLQGGDPRGGTGWYLHLGPCASQQLCLYHDYHHHLARDARHLQHPTITGTARASLGQLACLALPRAPPWFGGKSKRLASSSGFPLLPHQTPFGQTDDEILQFMRARPRRAACRRPSVRH